MMNPAANKRQPSTYQQLRQIAPIAAVRVNRKQARISPEPVGLESTFVVEERTFQDAGSGEFVTNHEGTSYVLACGNVVDSPYEIVACPRCSRLARNGRWKRVRFVCRRHGICVECARKEEVAMNGGGPLKKSLRFLLTLVLWPLFDRIEDDDQRQ